MKPDWKDAPEWANYLARDECGEWWWFEVEPQAYTDVGQWHNGGRAQLANPPWDRSLEPRP